MMIRGRQGGRQEVQLEDTRSHGPNRTSTGELPTPTPYSQGLVGHNLSPSENNNNIILIIIIITNIH